MSFFPPFFQWFRLVRRRLSSRVDPFSVVGRSLIQLWNYFDLFLFFLGFFFDFWIEIDSRQSPTCHRYSPLNVYVRVVDPCVRIDTLVQLSGAVARQYIQEIVLLVIEFDWPVKLISFSNTKMMVNDLECEAFWSVKNKRTISGANAMRIRHSGGCLTPWLLLFLLAASSSNADNLGESFLLFLLFSRLCMVAVDR